MELTFVEVLSHSSADKKPLRQMFFLSHRENPDKRLSSRYNMHDLLSAGFIPLTSGKKSKPDDDAFVELPRGFLSVYTSIEYKCASPLYQHTGSSRRTCLKTGRWSGRHVSCSPGESSNQSIALFVPSRVIGHAALGFAHVSLLK